MCVNVELQYWELELELVSNQLQFITAQLVNTDIGFVNFTCNGSEERLTDCPSDHNNGCGEDVGVICIAKCCS